ncbi:MAG TPA: cytochrome c oxidase assembly factor Coa1 family protein [Pyrinomonadaceae bacterium]
MVAGTSTPAAQTPVAAPPAQPRVSFGDAPRAPLPGSSMGQPQGRSGCGKVLLVLAIVGVVGLVGLGLIGYYGYKVAKEKLQTSEAYTIAMAALKADPEAADKLGDIKEVGFPLGNFQENSDGSGTAAYKVAVTGTKAKGDYTVVMMRRQRKWRLVSGKVTLAGGDVINIKSADEQGILGDPKISSDDDDNGAPPPAPRPPGKSAQGPFVPVGDLDGKAISKPEPAYPPVARAVHATGPVTVQIVVDESGKVTSAHATSGHPLLRQAAEQAAYQARFTPTLLSGRPVKVAGSVMYNFVAP